ncbi:hypothetical protein [Bradyrhizobium liaoningense]|uniref:hypothetical protein n=1 Tax=Bradyrhizobium liaoningense TaxID=43992 RepID=UPI003D9B2559
MTFCIVGAHAQLRDVLRAEGLADKTDSGQWLRSLDSLLAMIRRASRNERPDVVVLRCERMASGRIMHATVDLDQRSDPRRTHNIPHHLR